MKVLFVCKWNAGRSQMAEAFYNKYSKINVAISAGTHAEKYKGLKLSGFALPVIKCMKEVGFDLADKSPTQLTPQLVDAADYIYAMVDRMDVPDYLLNSNKVIFWDIDDAGGKDYVFHIKIRNQIEGLVRDLVRKIG